MKIELEDEAFTKNVLSVENILSGESVSEHMSAINVATEEVDMGTKEKIEENGHVWTDHDANSRCIYCQMRHNYYLDIKRASIKQPRRKDLKAWLLCPTHEKKGEEKVALLTTPFYVIEKEEK